MIKISNDSTTCTHVTDISDVLSVAVIPVVSNKISDELVYGQKSMAVLERYVSVYNHA